MTAPIQGDADRDADVPGKPGAPRNYRFERCDADGAWCSLCQRPGVGAKATKPDAKFTWRFCIECVARMARTLDVDEPRPARTWTITDDEPRVPCKRCGVKVVWVRNETGGPVPANEDGKRHNCDRRISPPTGGK